MVRLLIQLFGPRAFKAVVGGLTTASGTFMASCNLEDATTQVLTTAAAGLAGWLFTYIIPNKPE